MMSPGFALCLPYIRGIGLDSNMPDNLIPDDSVNWVHINPAIGDQQDWQDQLDRQWKRLRMGGTFTLWAAHATLPRANAGAWVNTKTWRCMEDDDDAGAHGHYLIVLEKRAEGQLYEAWRKPEGPSTCIVRLGGFGDGLLGAMLAPAYKNSGHYVSFIGSNFSAVGVQHDPNIDQVLTIELGRLKETDFAPLMQALERRYTQVINLGESIEGHIMHLPQRVSYYWPDAARRAASNLNFEEWTAKIGGVTFEPGWMRFYPTEDEKIRANELKAKVCPNGEKLVLWAVGGSGEQKTWPHLGAALTPLSNIDGVKWLLIGNGKRDEDLAFGAVGQVERYGGNLANVGMLMREASRPFRDVMALAQLADVVVGPETGIMNAVAYAPGVKKVLYLSHSSPENIPKHWTDCTTLTPPVPEYPCNRMHYPGNPCPRDPATGGAICAASLHPSKVVEAVKAALAASAPAAADYEIDGDDKTEAA